MINVYLVVLHLIVLLEVLLEETRNGLIQFIRMWQEKKIFKQGENFFLSFISIYFYYIYP